ncbi:hypothetical protein OCK02_24470 [Rhizobium sp. TRM96647]|uniref:DUF6766 family protein n=1 Tax=unclassified Rhizobium TaxID=2613769 RepID=UPI0021E6E458|nr:MULTISPECIES: DUF6766 family protein [unclassified Rhizobium]MCV3739326.1 hypothetical protein [Rhizobium sp. TRM96647]MCV3760992.1 hypothetical protein [Rhizobium sp. TRM96650]
MRAFRDNSLTIILVAATLLATLGMSMAGWFASRAEIAEHGAQQLSYANYLGSGHFLSALFENWESEFLQMATYVCLTAYFFQRGSAESRDPDSRHPSDEDPSFSDHKDAPWPVQKGGVILALYSYSLGIAFLFLFCLSFALHLWQSAGEANTEALRHGRTPIAVAEHLLSAQFWFESLQNWQSEFLSTALVVVFSIFLRYRGSPESKPVAAPHRQTG